MTEDKDTQQEEKKVDLEVQQEEADEVQGGTVKWFADEGPDHKLSGKKFSRGS
jgi:hypothetical protein